MRFKPGKKNGGFFWGEALNLDFFFMNEPFPENFPTVSTLDGRNPAPPGMVLKPCK